MKSRLAFLTLGLFAVVAVAWRFGERPSPEGLRSPVQRTQGAPVAHEASPEAGARLPRSEPRTTAPAEISASGLRAEPDPGPRPATELVLSGTVVVEDRNGSQRDRGAGEFALWTWGDSGGSATRVQVVEGTWSAAVPSATLLSVSDLVIDGRPALGPGWEERFPVPSDRLLNIRARWLPSSVLQVLDAETGRHLSGVDMVSTPGGWCAGHPGLAYSEFLVVVGAASPVELPAPAEAMTQRLFVRANGYAWTVVEVDRRRGGERTVRLQPAGAIAVSLSGHQPGPNAWLMLRPDGDDHREGLVELQMGADSVFTVDSVREGRYQAAYEVGTWGAGFECLATTDVVVEPGLTSTLVLVVPDRSPVARVPLSGTILVPEAWEEQFGLTARRLHPPGARSESSLARHEELVRLDSPGSFKWDLGLVEPGRYEVWVIPLPHSTVVEVGDEGLTDLHIELPPPAIVALRVVDESDQSPPDCISWAATAPGGRGGAAFLGPGGTFEFKAPVGRIAVTLDSRVYFDQRHEIEVEPGLNDVDVVARRSCGVVIWVEEGGTRLPFDASGVGVSVETELGQTVVLGWSSDGDSRRYHVSQPGRYRLSFTEVEGYLPVPARSVTVEPGRYVECGVLLERDE